MRLVRRNRGYQKTLELMSYFVMVEADRGIDMTFLRDVLVPVLQGVGSD